MFQVPLNRISEVMADRSGLGETGETILVGQDYLPRSDSFLDKENRSVVASVHRPSKARMKPKRPGGYLRKVKRELRS